MEAHVEPQDVQRQVGSEPVRGPPGDVPAQVAGDRLQHPDGQAGRDEEADRRVKGPERLLFDGAVDEVAHDLGRHELQAGHAEEQHAEQQHQGPVRPQVAALER